MKHEPVENAIIKSKNIKSYMKSVNVPQNLFASETKSNNTLLMMSFLVFEPCAELDGCQKNDQTGQSLFACVCACASACISVHLYL